MRMGVTFPQMEIGVDPGAIREFAQAAEDLGYSDLVAYDHVVGVDPEYYHDLGSPFTVDDAMHEPFVLFGYLASVTKRLTLVTGVIILGQRQTTLVAKQAAAVDVLSGGRLRLGLGTGRSYAEYEALGENFHNRGRRSEEQIALLRALWTNRLVNFDGRWHKLTRVGINPLPIQRPIPIWLGGASDPVLRRVAKLADGWYYRPHVTLDARGTLDLLRQYFKEAGRDFTSIGIQATLRLTDGDPNTWSTRVREWEELGVTHLALNTMGAGFDAPGAHVDAIRRFKDNTDPGMYKGKPS